MPLGDMVATMPSHRRVPHPVHGVIIGIMVLDTGFERLPGDIANAATWRFPVQFKVVRGVTPKAVIEGDPTRTLDAFYTAIDDLVALGVSGISTSCGFLAAVHPQLAAHSPIPLATSSLQQIPLALSLLPPGQTVGVVASDKAALTEAHFRNVGAPLGLPIGELASDGPIRTHMRQSGKRADAAAQEREVLAVVDRLLTETPSIGAIVLECANLPPFSAAIARTFGRPVFDIVSLVEWLHASLAPRVFPRPERP